MQIYYYQREYLKYLIFVLTASHLSLNIFQEWMKLNNRGILFNKKNIV